MEKKQLLLITKNADLLEAFKTKVNFSLEVTSVKSVHAGYTLALSYLPDAIVIDNRSLPEESTKNIKNFKDTHFLNKSHLFLVIGCDKESLVRSYSRHADRILPDSMDFQEMAEVIEEEVNEKRCLTNYWKDSFMALFNLLSCPVLLLQNQVIIAINDAFKKHFFVNSAEDLELTNFLDCRSKRDVLETLRNFERGKHMKAVTHTSLKVMNGKQREAKLSFSKLDRSVKGQLIVMIDFSENPSMFEEVGSTSRETEVFFENNNSAETFRFTKREKEIIELLCKGYKTREISEALCISEKTIEKHRSNIIKRTNSDTMLESIVYALNHKLIDI